MKVKAKKGCKGFVGGILRSEGKEFDCSTKDFTDTWMVKVKAKPGPKTTKIETTETSE